MLPFQLKRVVRGGLRGLVFGLLLGSAMTAQAVEFVHPGGLFKESDLERMRYQVAAGIDPWVTSFQELETNGRASYDYTVRGDPSWTSVGRDPAINRGAFESDVTAAYLNALMWAITQDTRHADKCVEIFNTWKNLTEVRGGGTESLNAGLFAWKLVEAAEIIRSTYDGWNAQDLRDFQDMLVYPGYSNTEIPDSLSNTNGTFYWRIFNGDPGRHGNQDMIAWRAMITMGVFLDNRIMYDRALRYFKGQPSRPDDLPYASGPSPSGDLIADHEHFTEFRYRGSRGTDPDYGYNGVLGHYVWENGQNQESSRDQQHAFFGMGIAAGIAEVAWNQGDDVWNSLDNRLLRGFEFMARYNTSFMTPFPDQPEPWEPENVIQRTDRTGRWFSKKINPFFDADQSRVSRGEFAENRPIYEQAVAHFAVRMGQEEEAVWTLRSRDVAIAESGYETTGWSLDHPGWGALTFRRPALAAGDPVSGFADGVPVYRMHRLPATIEGENFDYFPGDGEGRTYHNRSGSNQSGGYRDDGVELEYEADEGHFIANVENGEWISYTVSVPSDGWYRISSRYAAVNGDGKIRFAFGGVDVTGEVALPATGGLLNWTDRGIADDVYLQAGVQVLQLFFGGESGAFNLSSFSVEEDSPPTMPPAVPTGLSATAVSSVETQLSWTATLATSSYRLKRAPVSGGPYEIVADGVTGRTYSDSGLEAEATYYYVVSAVNDAGESGNSAETSVVTFASTDGVWGVDADGSWSDAANWRDGNVPDGIGVTADFGSIALTSDRLVSLDGNHTVGRLIFGTLGTSERWTMITGTEGGLNLETRRGMPEVEVKNSFVQISTKLSGNSGLLKSGGGTLLLTNTANDFTGGVTLDVGVFRATVGEALGTNAITVNSGATFELAPGLQIGNTAISISGTGAEGSGGGFYVDATGSGNQTRWGLSGIDPALTLHGDAAIRVDDENPLNSANFLVGRTHLNGFTLSKTGTGRLSFDTAGTGLQGSGEVRVEEGVLGFRRGAFSGNRDLVIEADAEARIGGDDNALGSTTNTVTVNGTLNLNGRGNGTPGSDSLSFSQTIGLLAGNGIITTGLQGSTGTQTLTVSHDDSADSQFAGVITQAHGALNLVKGGANTLVLSGMNDYRGNTTVEGGRLIVAESGGLTFYPGSANASNGVFGTGQVEFHGRFTFELGQASETRGDGWQIVDTQNLAVVFGETFTVTGFTQMGDRWVVNRNGAGYSFDSATGRLEVGELMSLPEGFERWRNAAFNSAQLRDDSISGPQGDFEGDGIFNLLEYAFGGDPWGNSRNILPRITAGNGYLEIGFWRVKEATDLVYQVEASSDLEGWETLWSSEDHLYSSSEEMMEETVTDDETVTQTPRRFLRLNVTLK